MITERDLRITEGVVRGKTYAQVGKTERVSGGRIRQIFVKTLRQLRNAYRVSIARTALKEIREDADSWTARCSRYRREHLKRPAG